mgnify:FL=1
MGLRLEPAPELTPRQRLEMSEVRSYVMTTDSPFKKNIEPKNGKWFTLEEMQRLVGGRIERVHHAEPHCDMYVNEEGKLDGLPYNKTATTVYHQSLAETFGHGGMHAQQEDVLDVVVDAIVVHHLHTEDFHLDTSRGE